MKTIWIGLYINELWESEEEFDNINEIENSDSKNENYHNIYHKKKECISFQILKTNVKQKM